MENVNTKIRITSQRFAGELIFTFNSDGVLIGYTGDVAMHKEGIAFFETNGLPFTLEKLSAFVAGSSSVKFEVITIDLSVDNFLKQYNYTIGRITYVKELWARLSETDRIAAIIKIAEYDWFLQHFPNQSKMYPQTWLQDRHFDTNYKELLKGRNRNGK